MGKPEIGIAFIGTGGVAHMHAAAVKQLPQARLVGAYSRNPENVTAFADRFGSRRYGALDELLEDPSVDVVSVLTPVPQHVSLSLKCLEAGKHVLVEKPVGQTAEEIHKLKSAAERADRICMPVHNYIYSPPIRRAKELIAQGKLGKLSSLWMFYNQKHPADSGRPDVLWRELHVHHAYVTLFLAGRPTRVGALASNIHFDDKASNDQGMILCELPDGVIANLWGSFGVDDKTSSPWTVVYKVLGTEGGITHSWNDCYYGDTSVPGWDLAGYRDSFLFVYEYLLTRCLEKGDPPLSTLDDALDALRLIEATEESIEKRTFADVKYL